MHHCASRPEEEEELQSQSGVISTSHSTLTSHSNSTRPAGEQDTLVTRLSDTTLTSTTATSISTTTQGSYAMDARSTDLVLPLVPTHEPGEDKKSSKKKSFISKATSKAKKMFS